DPLPRAVENVDQGVVGFEFDQPDARAERGEFAGGAHGDLDVVDAVEDEAGAFDLGVGGMAEAVAVEGEGDRLLLLPGVMVHLELPFATPAGDHLVAEDVLPARREVEGGGHHHHRLDLGVSGGGQRAEVAAERGSEHDGASLAGPRLGEDLLDLAQRATHGQAEKASLALVEVGDGQIDAPLGEAGGKEASLLRSRAGGETVQIEEEGAGHRVATPAWWGPSTMPGKATMSRKRRQGKKESSARELDRIYEGIDILDALLVEAGAEVDGKGAIARLAAAIAERRPASEVIPSLFPTEPRFASSEYARRLYGNLFGVWDLLLAGRSPEDLARARTPAPAPAREEFAFDQEGP